MTLAELSIQHVFAIGILVVFVIVFYISMQSALEEKQREKERREMAQYTKDQAERERKRESVRCDRIYDQTREQFAGAPIEQLRFEYEKRERRLRDIRDTDDPIALIKSRTVEAEMSAIESLMNSKWQ
jgi:hypothetical protein